MGLRARIRGRIEQALESGLSETVRTLRAEVSERLGRGGSSKTDPRRETTWAEAGKAPLFREVADTGLTDWLEQRFGLEEVGRATVGILQAQLTRSELNVREALDGLDALIQNRADTEGRLLWRKNFDQLLKVYQEQNQRLIETWGKAFEAAVETWQLEGEAVAELPWPRALPEVANRVDRVWLQGWENIQGILEDIAHVVKQNIQEMSSQTGLSPSLPSSVWQRALAAIDGGLRRAQGDLWGAWGTQAALLRGTARRIVEKEGTLKNLPPAAFQKMIQDFEQVIRANVQDLTDSWLHALQQLRNELERLPELRS